MVKLIENIISNTLVHKHKSKYLSLSKNKRLRSEWAQPLFVYAQT